jgi:hypothetical protein
VLIPILRAALALLSFWAKTEKTMPDEIFFLFIASCISLWLIQLATEWIDRRRDSRRIQRGTMMERYRSHLILVKAHQEPDTDGWRASVHVQFNEGTLTFRDVQLPGPTSHFPTKTTAEKHAVKEAKQWVDRRLREAKIFGR